MAGMEKGQSSEIAVPAGWTRVAWARELKRRAIETSMPYVAPALSAKWSEWADGVFANAKSAEERRRDEYLQRAIRAIARDEARKAAPRADWRNRA
jgi:hypothetical protein